MASEDPKRQKVARQGMPTAVVRRARIEDCGRMAELCGQLGYPSSQEDVERRLNRILCDPDRVTLVAELQGASARSRIVGRIVGWVDACLRLTVECEPAVEIAGLVVDRKVRGSGLGSLLMKRAEEWASEKGCSLMTVRSNVIRQRAHAFYERLGYSKIKTQLIFRKTLEARRDTPKTRQALDSPPT